LLHAEAFGLYSTEPVPLGDNVGTVRDCRSGQLYVARGAPRDQAPLNARHDLEVLTGTNERYWPWCAGGAV